ncbi:hypothetical protein HHI36_019348 [Cryptolaemus montrouzieri]|uniref:Phospholipid/glycerol acyltransferase domain-containing protein n=1 Tax=Cryptolaemus montrouzieri TaxID=559131 RepID=A0ABD2P3E7_9CUCU
MNTKTNSGIGSRTDCANEKLLNPFVHHLELDTTYEKIKTALLTIILLPIRVVVICCFLVAGWLVASAGLLGITEEELMEKPLTGWRSRLKIVSAYLIRIIFVIGGFRLKVIGGLPERDLAPLVALAPHSSFVDSLAMVYMGGPSIVAKGETASIPLFGKLINFTQPIYVFREDSNSRQNTIKEIIKRARSKLDWPQILIFPEGTCTNRSCLITFKPGAFYPGVPVQPVCIRYPNKIDTVTWTWDGPGALKLLWLTLTRPYSYCEIEFLPVYTPNEEEKNDPKLFANNVRKVMAKALGVPMSDYTYDDCKLLTRAKEMNLPQASSIVDLQKLRHSLGMANTNQEEALASSRTNLNLAEVTYKDFVNLLDIPPMELSSRQLFSIYKKVCSFQRKVLPITVVNYTHHKNCRIT